jgi:tetratricopeptide (TPR) repeat protein
MGKWSLAAALLQSCLQTHPDRGECLSLYGYCLARLGRLDEARSVCRRAVDMQSYVAEHHAHLGFVYQLAGLAPRALHCYRAALRLDSTNETALHGIALLQVRSWRARLRRWWRDVARPRSRPHPA